MRYYYDDNDLQYVCDRQGEGDHVVHMYNYVCIAMLDCTCNFRAIASKIEVVAMVRRKMRKHLMNFANLANFCETNFYLANLYNYCT